MLTLDERQALKKRMDGALLAAAAYERKAEKQVDVARETSLRLANEYRREASNLKDQLESW